MRVGLTGGPFTVGDDPGVPEAGRSWVFRNFWAPRAAPQHRPGISPREATRCCCGVDDVIQDGGQASAAVSRSMPAYPPEHDLP